MRTLFALILAGLLSAAGARAEPVCAPAADFLAQLREDFGPPLVILAGEREGVYAVYRDRAGAWVVVAVSAAGEACVTARGPVSVLPAHSAAKGGS